MTCAVHFMKRHLLRAIKTGHAVSSQNKAISGTRSKTRKVVYISSSKNIFENLAFEEWLYENADMTETDYLLMWRNGPTVVIGRHQNPWLECNVLEAIQHKILIARRNSGGGTVYHDEGNLNLSFLMHRSRYDRRRNLSLVVTAVMSHWDLCLDLNSRDDLVLDGVYKVSGTASKLGGNRTYHHFTLVIDVDKDILTSVLYCPVLGADSKATKSVPSPVKNLKEAAPDIDIDQLVNVIGQHFMEEEKEKEFTVVSPHNESMFPGVNAIQRRLGSWEWVFSKTPPFCITRTFVKSFLNSEMPYSQYSLRTSIAVLKGRLSDITLKLSGRPHDNNGVVDLPYRLLDIVSILGEKLESRRLYEVWERCWSQLRKMETEEDYELLVWGMQCIIDCVPVGTGDILED